MFADKLSIAVFAVMLVLAASVPAAAAGTGAASSETASESITVTLHTTQDATIVAVEHAGQAAANTDVSVHPVGDATYAGSGHYRTDADGSIRLPNPPTDVTVRVEVSGDSVNAAGVLTLSAYDGTPMTTSVSLNAAASADGTAQSRTSAADGAGTGHASASDSGSAGTHDHASFGQQLSSFIAGIVQAGVGGIGHMVSSFAIGHNPSHVDTGAQAKAHGGANAHGEAGAHATANVSANAGTSADVTAGSANGSADVAVNTGSAASTANGSATAHVGSDAQAGSQSTGSGASANGTVEAGSNDSVATNGGDASGSANGHATGGISLPFLG